MPYVPGIRTRRPRTSSFFLQREKKESSHHVSGRSVDPSIDRSIDHSIAHSIDPSIDRSLDCSIAPSIAPSLTPSLHRSRHRSIHRSIDHSIDRAIDRSIDRAFGRSVIHRGDSGSRSFVIHTAREYYVRARARGRQRTTRDARERQRRARERQSGARAPPCTAFDRRSIAVPAKRGRGYSITPVVESIHSFIPFHPSIRRAVV